MVGNAAGWSAAFLVLFAYAVGCSDDTQTTGVDRADLERQLCEAVIARDERCGREPDTLDRCLYHDDSQCFFDLIRPEVLELAVPCLADLPCSAMALACIYSAGDETPTTGQQEYLAACTTREDVCEPDGGFADYCELPYATTATYDRMMACLQLECDQVLDCLMGARPASCSS
jgi:hypothetical protein